MKWSKRPDFPAIQKLLSVALGQQRGLQANYLPGYIGIQNGPPPSRRRSWNFIAIKGSSTASFSLELKIPENEEHRKKLMSRANWFVDPFNQVGGYRVHLPEDLSDDDFQFLNPYVNAAFVEWTSL